MSLRRVWRNTGVVFLFMGTATLLYLNFSHWAYDDPFITFRYAANLRAGLGFVYNPGERVLSTTTPLYTLLLAGLGYLWPDLPHLSNLISAFSLALGGLFLYLAGRQWNEPVAGMIAAVLYPFFPLMVSTFGAEICLYVMLALGAFLMYAREQIEGAMTLAAIATLTRPDGVLVAIVLFAGYFVRRRKIPWRPLFIFSLPLLLWCLFSWTYFGYPFPSTLMTKQHQGQMAISESFAQGFLRLLKGYAKEAFYWLHGILAVLGLMQVGLKARQWLPLLIWALLYFVSYVALGVTRYFWYYAPLVPAILVAVGLGASFLHQRLPPNLARGWCGRVLIVILLGLLLWPQIKGLRYMYHHPDSRARIYREAGTWIAQNTPSEATVGTLEVGIVGYYAHRRMIDFAGLIQPDVALQMRRETTYQDTAIWAVHRYHPDYLILNPQWFPSLMESLVLKSCVPRMTFVRKEYPGELVVYECKWAE